VHRGWPQVYDRAQVFVGNNSANRMYLGTLERWSANSLTVATAAALPGSQLDILVENMGRVNYGPFMGENKVQSLPLCKPVFP
jgi:beta-galactosidase